jgi:hypothetical protein
MSWNPNDCIQHAECYCECCEDEIKESDMSKIEWKFVDNPPDQSSSDDDWYSICNGYISPGDVLVDVEQEAMVYEAISVLESFFYALREEGIRMEM